MNKIKINTKLNLLNNKAHIQFIELQAAYGFAQRGESKLPTFSGDHSKRIVNDVNLLSTKEVKQLIFNETIFSN
jgi:hypothetical protein